MEVIARQDPDIYLRPDPDTIRIVPWCTEPTAQVIRDCYRRRRPARSRSPPRSVLRGVSSCTSARLEPVVAPELEFFLVQLNTDPDYAAAAADRPLGPDGDGAPVLRHRCGQRVRPDVRGRLRLLRGAGASTSTR